MLKPSGHRLEDKHNQIIRKWAKRWNIPEAAALRKIIELIDDWMQEKQSMKPYEGK